VRRTDLLHLLGLLQVVVGSGIMRRPRRGQRIGARVNTRQFGRTVGLTHPVRTSAAVLGLSPAKRCSRPHHHEPSALEEDLTPTDLLRQTLTRKESLVDLEPKPIRERALLPLFGLHVVPQCGIHNHQLGGNPMGFCEEPLTFRGLEVAVEMATLRTLSKEDSGNERERERRRPPARRSPPLPGSAQC
jgi:hypothetical protein